MLAPRSLSKKGRDRRRRVRIIRHHAEVIQVRRDSFEHADHPQPVETNKLSLIICIEPKIHDHVFATLQSLQPVNAIPRAAPFC
jgi:hypothetical protein